MPGRHRKRRRGAVSLPVLATALAVTAVVVPVTLVLDRDGTGPAAAPRTSAATSSSTPSPASTSPASTNPPAGSQARARLTVTGAESFVVVQRGDEVLMAERLQQGRLVEFTGPELDVLIADGGAVTIQVNNHPPRSAGSPGEPARFIVRPG